MHCDPELLAAYMRALSNLESCGRWGTVRIFLALNERFIRRFGSSNQIAELEQSKIRLDTAEKYEEEHGLGSLIQRDHPISIKLNEIMSASSVGQLYDPPLSRRTSPK